MFGGVPIGVPTPPILAEYARPNINTSPNPFSICFCESKFLSPFKEASKAICLTTAMATGSIIIVDAVLDIHIDKNAVAIMNPKTIRFGSVPITEMIHSARRL